MALPAAVMAAFKAYEATGARISVSNATASKIVIDFPLCRNEPRPLVLLAWSQHRAERVPRPSAL